MNELFLTKSKSMRAYGIILAALLLLFAPASKAIAPAGLPVGQRIDFTAITPKQIEKLTGKKFITAIFLSASLLLTSFYSNAAVSKENIEIISGEKTNIHFAGSTTDALMFKVSICRLSYHLRLSTY